MRYPFLPFASYLPPQVAHRRAIRLDFQITGLKDTTIYLGNYYGETTYLKDTARVNSKGEFVFEGKKPLTYQGVYFLVMKKQSCHSKW